MQVVVWDHLTSYGANLRILFHVVVVAEVNLLHSHRRVKSQFLFILLQWLADPLSALHSDLWLEA